MIRPSKRLCLFLCLWTYKGTNAFHPIHSKPYSILIKTTASRTLFASTITTQSFTSLSARLPFVRRFRRKKNVKEEAILDNENSTEDENTQSISGFPTWTFDKPCESMDRNSIPNITMSVIDASTVTSDTKDIVMNTLDDSDLIILGIYKNDDEDREEDNSNNNDDEEDMNDDNEEVDVDDVDDDDIIMDKNPKLEGQVKELDDSLNGALSTFMIEQYKEFKNGSVIGSTTSTFRIMCSINGNYKTKRYILLGLGKSKNITKSSIYFQLGSKIASRCHAERVSKVSIVLPHSFIASSPNQTETESTNIDGIASSDSSNHTMNDNPYQSIVDMTTQFYSALYSDNRYRTKPNIKTIAKELSSITFLVDDDLTTLTSTQHRKKDIESAFHEGKTIAEGIYIAKDIVNAPHNVLNSNTLATVAQQLCNQSDGSITCTILGKHECEQRGMGAYLGVARGSETDPQFIHLTYRGHGIIQ